MLTAAIVAVSIILLAILGLAALGFLLVLVIEKSGWDKPSDF